MRDELLEYFERELSYLRKSGAHFAKEYPKVASRLLLEPNKCDDPHVERILEGFAFLAARIHLKIDDDFSEVSEALLNVISPNYIRPVPSISLVEFELDPEQGKVTSGLEIPKGSILKSRPVRGVPCRFRTSYDNTLWPLTIEEVQWVAPHQLDPSVTSPDAVGALRVVLQCLPDVTFPKIEMSRLRLHLNGEGSLVSTLYELLCNSCQGVAVRALEPDAPTGVTRWPGSAVTPVGFEEDEGLVPTPRRAFAGYQLLQDYFSFPQKYHFIDLSGFETLPDTFGSRAEIVFLFSSFELPDRRYSLEAGVSKNTLRLGCTPVVNLFPQTSEPIQLNQRKSEYLVLADARRRLETGIFSVDEVLGITPGRAEPLRFDPFYSHKHSRAGNREKLFWNARRKGSEWRSDAGTDVMVSFLDLSGRVMHPDEDSVSLRLTCHNGELPSQLPFGDPAGDFQLEQGVASVRRITALTKPTDIVEPPLGKPLLWRLISQLSLNYLSLVDGDPEPLKELLRVYNFLDSPSAEGEIDGIISVDSFPAYSRVQSEYGLGFVRGRRVEMTFDEERFTGGGVYLFAAVIERFLAMYASLNSFTTLSAHTRQRKGPLREWAPRAGWKPLV